MFECVRLVRKSNSQQNVRFCSITEPNRTIGVRLGSTEFWFDFVRLDTLGTCQDGPWTVHLKLDKTWHLDKILFKVS